MKHRILKWAFLVAVACSPLRACEDEFRVLKSGGPFAIANRLRKAMGLGTGFHTSLRVEEKSTNDPAQVDAFVRSVQANLGPGESFELRDKPSDPSRVLVTSTNYPFDRAVQNALSTRIRVREYGERRKGSSDRFESTSGDFVSLEVKAKTGAVGVVVKPVLKLQKGYLDRIFKDLGTFDKERKAVAEKLRADNPDMKPEVIDEVLASIREFHTKTLELGLPMSCINIEYERQAYVLTVKNQTDPTRSHKVQVTFDRAVDLRDGADPRVAPFQASARPITASYPDGKEGVVVVEMKSDLLIDSDFTTAPAKVRTDVPTYYIARQAYGNLQVKPSEGFRAGSGKAAQLMRLETE